jgi:uncharacterized membrane protein YdjX (TVP38/TMEM64 family)
MRSLKTRILVVALFALLLGGVYWLQRDLLTFEEIVRREMQLRSWIERNPLTAFAAGFGVYVLVSMVPATSGKSIVFGWFFGFWQATIMIDFALAISATIAFLFSRYVFHDVVKARLAGFYQRLNEHLERDGPFYLLAVRLMHAPYTLVNYTAGATGIRTWTFWWTTLLGLLPGTIVCALVGSRLPSLKEMQDRGFWSLLDPLLIVGLAVTAILPFVIRLGLYFWRKQRPRHAPQKTADEPIGEPRRGNLQ